MAVTVGLVSENGGVGKTTACYHIAVALNWYHNLMGVASLVPSVCAITKRCLLQS